MAKEAGSFDAKRENLSMLQNLCTVLKSHPVKHFCLITGAKYYGMHLGENLYPGYKIPFHPDTSARAPGPNWYFAVEDFLKEKDFEREMKI